MTLVEILIAMLILGILIIAIFPLITQSLQTTNLSNKISSQLFDKQSEIEIVAVTKDGVYLEGGTFFPVSTDDNITWVSGSTVKKGDLVRFLADKEITSYDQYEVYEGYTEEEGTFTIIDKSLNISSQLEIIDQSNKSFTGPQLSAEIIPGNSITFTLPTSGNRLTNRDSPYIIKTKTGNKDKTGILLVHLPRAVIAKDNGQLLIASSPSHSNWFKESDGSSNWVELYSNIPLNKIISIGASESEAAFIAVGKNGGIYSWENNGTVFKKENSPAGAVLNDIIATSTGLFAVGNNGVILQSSDGKTWNMRESSTTQNLNAIAYSDDKFVVVGDNGTMLTSSNGSSWNLTSTSNQPVLINGKEASFTSASDCLKTLSEPVSGSKSRTVFMVVKPDEVPVNMNLFTMGSATGYFTLRTDKDGNLAVQKNDEALISTNLQLVNDSVSIVACHYDSGNVTIYKDGNASANLSIGTIDTGNKPIYFGSHPPIRFNDDPPLSFNGSIIEIFIFDKALSKEDSRGSRLLGGYFSCDMDIVQKYLSLKHNITPINASLDDTYYNQTLGSKKLSTFNGLSDWESGSRWPLTAPPPNYKNLTKGTLWLEASNGTITSNRIFQLNDKSGNNNHAIVPSLKAVASSDKTHFYAAGDHRNLLFYNGNAVSQDTAILNGQTGKAIQYRIDDMIYAHDRYIALLNDDLGSSNKYIATLDRPDNYTDVKITSSNNLNDIFHYTPSDTLLAVGNNGTIYYSDDGVIWTNKTLSGNLVAGCLR